ncbi:MAG: sulfatase [Acidobacteriota bacterium]|nr:sulfatase [Acidobacteriota bacterium]
MLQQLCAPTFLALLLLLLPACRGPEPERFPVFEDFVTHPEAARVSGAAELPTTVYCGDETRYGWVLEDGAQLVLPLPADRAVGDAAAFQLRVSGCLSHPSQDQDLEGGPWRISAPVEGDGAGAATLTVASSWRSAPEEHDLVDLNADPAWWQRDWVLTPPQGAEPAMTLTVRLPAERKLNLSDLYLEYLAPVPAFGEEEAADEGAPPQVLFLSLDTLREDGLSILGGPWETPHLDRLAREGELWTPHYAAATWTKPSHATLLTGYPPQIYGGKEGELDPRVPTLAERLRAAGFATRGLTYDCVWLDPRFGFGRGFEQYESRRWGLDQAVRETANWITLHRSQPFFFFLHTFEPHSDFHRLPYEAPGISRETVAQRWGLYDYGCTRGFCGSARLARMSDGRMRPRQREDEALPALYGAGVTAMDAEVGQLLDHLRALGIYDDLLIVVTSDHGESLLEQGRVLHGNPWNEVLRVPLIIKWPGGGHAGVRRDQVSSALDVVPTILDALGLPHDDLSGVPLHRRRPDRPAFAGIQWSIVVQENLKGVYDPQADRWSLFDLATDPAEEHDLAAQHPEHIRHLGQLLQNYRRDSQRRLDAAGDLRRRSEQEGLTPEERERLRSLGYLGDSG